LRLGRAGGGFHRAVHTRAGRTLRRTDAGALAVEEGHWSVTVFDPRERAGGGFVTALSWLPDGRILAGTVFGLYLFDPDANRVVRAFAGPADATAAIAPGPDPRYFVTASADMTLRVWDVGREEPLLSVCVADDKWVSYLKSRRVRRSNDS
jgi:WD40 repeat protein